MGWFRDVERARTADRQTENSKGCASDCCRINNKKEKTASNIAHFLGISIVKFVCVPTVLDGMANEYGTTEWTRNVT